MSQVRQQNFKEYKRQVNDDAYYHRPNDFLKEGEDHINLSIQSTTRLGKVFDPAYLKVVNYPYIGKFCSVFSLWSWLKADAVDDSLRRLTGPQLRKHVRYKKMSMSSVPNFKAIVAYATWMKIKDYPSLLEEIKKLSPEVKLLSYDLVKGSELRVCTKYAPLIISIANHIVAAVQEDREPDFSEFLDKPHLSALNYLEGALEKVFPKEKIEALKSQ